MKNTKKNTKTTTTENKSIKTAVLIKFIVSKLTTIVKREPKKTHLKQLLSRIMVCGILFFFISIRLELRSFILLILRKFFFSSQIKQSQK